MVPLLESEQYPPGTGSALIVMHSGTTVLRQAYDHGGFTGVSQRACIVTFHANMATITTSLANCLRSTTFNSLSFAYCKLFAF